MKKVFILGTDLQPGAGIDPDYYDGQNLYKAPLIYIFYQKCFSFALTSGHKQINKKKHQDISLLIVTASSRKRNQILDSFVLGILERRLVWKLKYIIMPYNTYRMISLPSITEKENIGFFCVWHWLSRIRKSRMKRGVKFPVSQYITHTDVSDYLLHDYLHTEISRIVME